MPPPKLAPDALARDVVAALRDGVEDVYPGDVAQDWRRGSGQTRKCSSASSRRAEETVIHDTHSDRYRRQHGNRRRDLPQPARPGLQCRDASARRPAGLSSPRLRSVLVDLGDVEATRQAAREVAQAEPVTIVVHNAGAIREKPLEEVPVSDLDALVHLHLAAPLCCWSRRTSPAMRAAALWARRADLLARGAGSRETHRVCRDQGRHARSGAHVGARACTVGHHRQRRGTRADRGDGDVR